MTQPFSTLTLEQFPVTVSEKLRFGDTDRLGHINNAVFATMCESGRVAFLYDPQQPLVQDGAQFVIAKLTIHFIAEMNWPSEVAIGTGVARVGNSSFDLVQGLFVAGRQTAFCESVLVMMDEKTRRSTPLPDGVRARLVALSLNDGD